MDTNRSVQCPYSALLVKDLKKKKKKEESFQVQVCARQFFAFVKNMHQLFHRVYFQVNLLIS